MLSPYSVSYSSDKYYRSYISCKKTPYQDWLDKNKPSVIFKYSEHYGDDVLHMYFEPSANLIYILGDFDYYSLNIIATFIIDNFTKKLTIDKIFCESDNYWPEIFINKSPSNGIGGISKYKQNIAFWTSQDITFDNAIKYFFGEDWYLIIPITRPFLHNAKELVKHYDDYFDRFVKILYISLIIFVLLYKPLSCGLSCLINVILVVLVAARAT